MKKCYKKFPSNKEIYVIWNTENIYVKSKTKNKVVSTFIKMRQFIDEYIFSNLGSNISILEVGYGGLPVITRYNYYVAIDFALFNKEDYKNVEHIKCSFNSLPFKEEKIFDAIIWIEGVEHSTHPIGSIRELKKLLKSIIIITAPNNDNCGNKEHYWSFIKDDISYLLEKNNFKVEYVDIISPSIIGIGRI